MCKIKWKNEMILLSYVVSVTGFYLGSFVAAAVVALVCVAAVHSSILYISHQSRRPTVVHAEAQAVVLQHASGNLYGWLWNLVHAFYWNARDGVVHDIWRDFNY